MTELTVTITIPSGDEYRDLRAVFDEADRRGGGFRIDVGPNGTLTFYAGDKEATITWDDPVAEMMRRDYRKAKQH